MRQYTITRDPNDAFLSLAASLHYESLSYRSFITMFGHSFLVELYRRILASGSGFLVVAREDDRFDGFILACQDSSKLTRLVASRSHVFIPKMLPALLRNPRLLVKVWQTMFYAKNEGVDIKPELVVIAVTPHARSRGIGRELLRALDDEFARQSIARYKVTVHEEMEASNRFYVQNGMKVLHVFEMYGVRWNVYLRDIENRS